MRLVVFSSLVLLGAACAPDVMEDQEGGGVATAAIVGGGPEVGEPAVVVVKARGGFSLCTGTLISPSVVLTAKHCVQAAGADRPYAPTSIRVGFGTDSDTSTDYRVKAVRTTPGAYTSTVASGLGGALIGVDVATVTLREPITDVTPLRVGRERPVPGQMFTAIGFGRRPDGESGDKYTTTSRIERITGNVLNTSMTICSGDSGGPAIIEDSPRIVVGVASFGVRDQCPSSSDGYNLVEPFLYLIEAAILGAGECPYDSPAERTEECNSIDDNCDGTIDEGCKTIGEACTEDDECAFSALPPHLEASLTSPPNVVFCGETQVGRVCTQRCDPTSPATACQEVHHALGDATTPLDGVYCAHDAGCDGLCTPGTAGTISIDGPCTEDTECLSLRCDDPGDGNPRCLSACVGDAGLCPVTEACGALPGNCGSCIDTAILASPRGLGEACDEASECRSGLCESANEVTYCTAPCEQDAECGVGYHCREGLCTPGGRDGAAVPCISPGDCRFGDRCERGFCSRQCTRDETCPEDFSCDGVVCVPAPGFILLGERCTEDDTCVDGSCLEVGDGSRCATPCGAEGAGGPCPPRFECRRVEDSLLCVLPEVGDVVPWPRLGGGGGCSVVDQRTGSAPPPALAIALVFSLACSRVVGRRRRRQPRQPR